MVAGIGEFDTRLMEAGRERLVSKGGAEGYQGVGLLTGAVGPESPGIGIALKVSDGDPTGSVRAALTIALLKALGVLSATRMEELADFGPEKALKNHREVEIGAAAPLIDFSALAGG
jgi:L-asparaginase II